MSARDLQGEIRELRGRIAALMDEAANNEKLLRRSQERELELLNVDAGDEVQQVVDDAAAAVEQPDPHRHGGDDGHRLCRACRDASTSRSCYRNGENAAGRQPDARKFLRG